MMSYFGCQRRSNSDPPGDVVVGVNLTHLGPFRLVCGDHPFGALSRFALVLKPVALARDLHDVGVMQ